MLGFSVYLNDIDATYIQRMRENGFEFIFTSLQIPEESHDDVFLPLTKLSNLVDDTMIIVDINPRLFDEINNRLDYHLGQNIALRFDESIDIEKLVEWSRHSKIVLNASTDAFQILQSLDSYDFDFNQVIIMHNYYPRPETGLDAAYFEEQNLKIKNYFPDVKIMAFVCGTELRGPIYKGLPTLENHRLKDPLLAAYELKLMGVDDVCIADVAIDNRLMLQMDAYFNRQELLLNISIQKAYEFLTKMTLHQRTDVARDVIRIEEGRKVLKNNVLPENSVDRITGTITIDNCNYGRYMNEIQITKRDLLADDKVNVIGHVVRHDIPYLQLARPHQVIRLIKEEE